MVSVLKLVHDLKFGRGGLFKKLLGVGGGDDLVPKAPDEADWGCNFTHSVDAGVVNSLHQPFEVGHEWHQPIDHGCYRSKSVFNDHSFDLVAVVHGELNGHSPA